MMGRTSTGETRGVRRCGQEKRGVGEAYCAGADPSTSLRAGSRTTAGQETGATRRFRQLLFPVFAFFFVFDFVAFAGREKQVGFEAVLAGVKVVIAAAVGKQFSMVAALDDEALLDH
jgi:hypothetical protein